MSSRRSFAVATLPLLVLLVGCPGGGQRTAALDRAPAIVLVTVDGIVPDLLSAFGGEVPTLALAELAKEGVAWRDAWTACPMTRPAVATYLTGAAPEGHGVWDDEFAVLVPERTTLAEALHEAGYQTAAFPASSFLGRASGLHQGFDVVADPPAQAAWRRLPMFKDADAVVTDVKSWLDGIPKGTRYFAWVHFADAGAAQAEADDSKLVAATGKVDAAIGKIVATLRERGDLAGAVIAIAGTFGDVTGGADGVAGPGFSLDARAVQVPVIVRAGARPLPAEAASRAVWAPDVPAFLASAGSARLDAEDGLDLREAAPGSRAIGAWSRAPRDQMGWKPLAAQRESTAPAMRPVPLETGIVPVDRVTSVLEDLLGKRGLRLEPVPIEGREFGPPDRQRAAAAAVATARLRVREKKFAEAIEAYAEGSRVDPAALAPLFERASIVMGRASGKQGVDFLREAVRRYPWSPDALHTFGHFVFATGRKDAAEALWNEVVVVWPTDMDVLYDLACTRSLAGDLPASESFLRRAIANGFNRWRHIEADPDLRNLRASPKFVEIMRDLKP